MQRERVAAEFRKIQEEICEQLGALDGIARFNQDHWERAEGGGGLTRVMAGGALIEKGGVNFSEVFGPLTPQGAKALNVDADGFYATGVSIVLHAHNPWVPTIHMNIRYFEAETSSQDEQPLGGRHAWFGGGIDLTPVYVDTKAARHFHTRLKQVCDGTDPLFYQRFKTWADDYFFLPHRSETRGIGGIFFDRLSGTAGHSLEQLFLFTCALGRLFADLYTEVAAPVRDKSFGLREKEWQLLRRGRYVEFNLVHDRGTRFGLETGGRTESILMSLPAEARWQYDHQPAPDSLEAATLSWLRKGVEWV